MSLLKNDVLWRFAAACGLALCLGIFAPVACAPEGEGVAPASKQETQQRIAEDEASRSKTVGKSPMEGQNIKGRLRGAQ
jgi:hypothetical protein